VPLPEFDLSDPDAAMFCPGCAAGYTARVSRCADCDRELIPRSEIEELLAAAADREEPASLTGPAAIEEPPLPLPEFDLSDPDAVAFCPGCGAGYRAGPLVCTDCGTDLRPRSWVESNPGASEEPGADPVALADVDNLFRAHVLASALRDQEIWFLTQPAGSGFRFLVSSSGLDLARQILSDIDEEAAREPP
jgi:hypothetical protein